MKKTALQEENAQLKAEVERLKADLLQAEYERAKARSDRHKAECRADRLREENERLTKIIQHGLGERDLKNDTLTPRP